MENDKKSVELEFRKPNLDDVLEVGAKALFLEGLLLG